MRLEGYDAAGKILKRFEVVSTQKIDNRWFLKQMRVEELQPGTNKVQARTYLEIKRQLLFVARGFHNLGKAAGIEAGPADERAVNIGLRHQLAHVFRFHAAAGLNPNA